MIDFTDIEKMVRNIIYNPYTSKFENLYKKGKFLKERSLPK